jgi:hypothetical protein
MGLVFLIYGFGAMESFLEFFSFGIYGHGFIYLGICHPFMFFFV